MEDATAAATQEPRPCVVMVHGTWGKSSPLGSVDSNIGKRFTHEGYEVECLLWRGGNWHRDRLRAARCLAEKLNDGQRDVVVIAHSHGGNVAQMGLRAAGPSDHRRHLITLGTPFVALESPAPGRSTKVPFRLSTFALWCITAAFLLLGRGPGPNLMAATVGAAAAFVTLSLLLGLGLRHHEVDQVRALLEPPPASAATSVTTILTPGDEAGLVLSLGLLTGYLTGGILTRVAMWILRLLGALLLITSLIWAIWVLSIVWDSGLPDGDLVEELLWQPLRNIDNSVFPGSDGYSGMPEKLRFASSVLLGALVTLPLISGLVAMTFVSTGWDGLRMARHGRLAVSAIPPGAHTAVCVDVPRLGRSQGLGHSRLTSDPTVVGLIVAEVKRVLEPTPGDPVARHMPTALETWGTTAPKPAPATTQTQRLASTHDASDTQSPPPP